MRLYDVNYGQFEVDEPVLVELISSGVMDRLKRIGQMGIPAEYYPFFCYSRYEHSVGVMLLLRRLGASLEEQAAGLLHDASHTAFSHVIDWVLGEGAKGNEDLQDLNHKAMLNSMHVPEILEKHGMDFDRISDIKRFGLLEREVPGICADRLDYALKEFYYWENRDASRECLDGLTVLDGKIVFKHRKPAEAFGRNYMEIQNMHWGGTVAATQYYLLSELLRAGLKKGIIVIGDLNADDAYVMEKLKKAGDVTLDNYFRLLSYKGRLPEAGRAGGQKVVKKFRYVDPEYMENGGLVRLSEIDAGYRRLLDASRERSSKGVTINVSFGRD